MERLCSYCNHIATRGQTVDNYATYACDACAILLDDSHPSRSLASRLAIEARQEEVRIGHHIVELRAIVRPVLSHARGFGLSLDRMTYATMDLFA